MLEETGRRHGFRAHVDLCVEVGGRAPVELPDPRQRHRDADGVAGARLQVWARPSAVEALVHPPRALAFVCAWCSRVGVLAGERDVVALVAVEQRALPQGGAAGGLQLHAERRLRRGAAAGRQPPAQRGSQPGVHRAAQEVAVDEGRDDAVRGLLGGVRQARLGGAEQPQQEGRQRHLLRRPHLLRQRLSQG